VEKPIEPWIVCRPVEVSAVVETLLEQGALPTAGITTALHGAGGFGKTTLARMVSADQRIVRHYRKWVYWVTLGRDARHDVLVYKVNDLLRRLEPERLQPFSDVRQAADHLAAVLAGGPPRLIVLDDVWFDDQLSAFPVAGKCARLVTTRVNSVVAGKAAMIPIDAMPPEQARLVLTDNLLRLSASLADELLAATGGWPLLLRLIKKVLVEQGRADSNLTSSAEQLLRDLSARGKLEVDDLTGARYRRLDVSDPQQRQHAITATIEASAGLLAPQERDRFNDLAVFAEDEPIPSSLAAVLWNEIAGLSPLAASGLCACSPTWL
jgi:hypothetical protein